MARRPRKAPSQTLAAVHAQSERTQTNPLIAAIGGANGTVDDRDVRVAVVVGTGQRFLNGRVIELVMEADKTKGPAQLKAYDDAIYYLGLARAQAVAS